MYLRNELRHALCINLQRDHAQRHKSTCEHTSLSLACVRYAMTWPDKAHGDSHTRYNNSPLTSIQSSRFPMRTLVSKLRFPVPIPFAFCLFSHHKIQSIRLC